MSSSQKTLPTHENVDAFIAAVPAVGRRDDARELCRLMEEWTGVPPTMWGPSIIGFGSFHYRYDSGREGTAPLVGFSPRKANLVLYVLVGGSEEPKLLERLGPHKRGKSCLYLKRLDDVDREVLAELVERTAVTAAGRANDA